jgi:hypothetical protein
VDASGRDGRSTAQQTGRLSAAGSGGTVEREVHDLATVEIADGIKAISTGVMLSD